VLSWHGTSCRHGTPQQKPASGLKLLRFSEASPEALIFLPPGASQLQADSPNCSHAQLRAVEPQSLDPPNTQFSPFACGQTLKARSAKKAEFDKLWG
jgi:hypothetical protein